MSKPIVVGADGTPGSEPALDWAITEAHRRSLPLLVLHAGDVDDYPAVSSGTLLERTHGQRVAANAVEVAHARGVSVSSVVIPGSPADVLAGWSTDASMIVLGHRGLSRVDTAIHGSVGSSVTARAQCPVVVVRRTLTRQAPVVVGVDGSPASKSAIAFALDYAARTNTWVRAVHAWRRNMLPGAGDLAAERAAHLKVVTDAVASVRDRFPTVPVRVSRPTGRPDEILTNESMTAQLLVVGTRGHGYVTGLLLGSVSQALLRTAGCPLAVIPEETRS
jgi:nucleotide-binding universal stress UspA family protein